MKNIDERLKLLLIQPFIEEGSSTSLAVEESKTELDQDRTEVRSWRAIIDGRLLAKLQLLILMTISVAACCLFSSAEVSAQERSYIIWRTTGNQITVPPGANNTSQEFHRSIGQQFLQQEGIRADVVSISGGYDPGTNTYTYTVRYQRPGGPVVYTTFHLIPTGPNSNTYDIERPYSSQTGRLIVGTESPELPLPLVSLLSVSLTGVLIRMRRSLKAMQATGNLTHFHRNQAWEQ